MTVNRKPVTVSGIGAKDRTYDGTRNAELETTNAVFEGKLVSDTLTVSATVTFVDANAGDSKTVTISGLTLGGEKAGNYVLSESGQQTSTTASISKAAMTVTAVNQSIYVGGTVPTLSGADFYIVTGLLGTDTLTTAPTLAYQKDGSAATPDNTAAGTYDIVASGASAGDNYAIRYTKGTLTISDKGTQTITADDVTATYGDTDKSVSASVTNPATGGGAISYAVKDGSADYIDVDATTGALNIKKVPADGKAYVVVTAAGTAAYEQATKDVTVTVNKAASTVTKAPTAKNLIYTGQAQALVTAGEATGGTMQYALGTYTDLAPTDGWSENIPTGIDIGAYNVWYKVVGDANHNNSTPACLPVRIAPDIVTVSYDANGGFGAPDAETGRSDRLMISQTVPTMYTGDSYRITLDYNDGSGSKSIMSTLHRYYYNFTGWNTARDGSGTSYQPGDAFAGYDSVTLYAQWRAGGEASAPVQLPTPKRDDYDFVGWGKNADAETGVSGRYVPISDVTLYAVWTLKQYTVTFDTDGGTEIAPVTGVAGTEIPAPAAPEKFGFLFAGWDREIPATMPDEDITIKALWKPTQFGTADFILPAALTEIEEEAFEGAAMMAVYVPDTVEVIGANAFKDCELLWKIRLPKDCEIDETAFDGCTAFLVYAPAGGSVEKFCAEQESIIFVPEVEE